jgi:hypothetical protein
MIFIDNNMKTFTITFYSDPSHGWAKVKRSILETLDIPHLISSYSYQRGEYVYLEEDNDYSLLVDALEMHGTAIILKYKHNDNTSRIRSYEHYVHN